MNTENSEKNRNSIINSTKIIFHIQKMTNKYCSRKNPKRKDQNNKKKQKKYKLQNYFEALKEEIWA